jgi:NADH-quinone oxidoreductase subunit J
MSASFTLLALLTVASAVTALSFRRLVHCALCSALAFLGFAALYLQLGAQFVGFAQVLVYVGAVAILVVFAILLTRNSDASTEPERSSSWILGLGIAALTSGSLAFSVLSTASVHRPPPATLPEATTRVIGEELMTRFILPLEVIGLLLTAALIGAVLIAMKEREVQP